jgi:hypothetical protein
MDVVRLVARREPWSWGRTGQAAREARYWLEIEDAE